MADRVTAVEIDDVLAGALPATIGARMPERADRFELVHSDAMQVTELPGPAPTALVANLPYNVAVPVLLHMLETFPSIERTLVMVQAEVAERRQRAAAGAGPCPLSTKVPPRSASNPMTGTSPPGPFRCGSTTCSTRPAATAASNALPSRSSTARPAADASQCVEATMPNVPRSSGRVEMLIVFGTISAGYSGTSQTAPSGGRLSSAEYGWSCHPTASASTPPRLPTPERP